MPDPTTVFSWTEWHWHPSIIIGLSLFQGLYLLSIGPFREHFGLASSVEYKRLASFTTGSLILFLGLASPLHDLGDNYLFSAHMVQHLIFMLVTPPLLILGIPRWLMTLVLSPRLVLSTARILTSPLVAFVVFNIVLALWHIPSFYEVTLENRSVHITEHTMFIISGVILWWPVINPFPGLHRLTPPIQLLYLFAQSIPMGFLGAALTFSGDALYSFYVKAPTIWNISTLSDQQMGGLIMKTAAGVVFTAILITIFLKWFELEEGGAKRAALSRQDNNSN